MHTRKLWALFLLMAGTIIVPAQSSSDRASTEDQAALAVVKSFEAGLQNRDRKQIEKTVAEDIVVFENGHRNDGWIDFRDNHLAHELQEPAPPMKTELVKSKIGSDIAWIYTRSEFPVKTKAGPAATATLWSVYVLEKRPVGWKIAMLDWSIRVPR